MDRERQLRGGLQVEPGNPVNSAISYFVSFPALNAVSNW